MSLANRVILPGMDMNRCEDGVLTQAEIDHYTARAAGGAALVITGASAISWPIGATSRKQAALSHDRYLPGLRRLAESVHAVGGRLGVQLVHHGKVAAVDTAEGRALLVPSIPSEGMDLAALVDNPIEELMGLASATEGKPARFEVATHADIEWVIDQFADAAARVQAAGGDAVEIHGAHGYLISAFLSAAYNHRDDEYGGSIENRSRVLVRVIRAVRDRVGGAYPILVRLNGCEYSIDHGVTPDESAMTARLAEDAGADAIHVSANAAHPFRDFTLGPLPAEAGQYREMAAIVKQAVAIPVIAVGRLHPELAEEMLANGECDFVAMGRQQLADPELVNKLRRGRRASIRPCVNCYVCVEQNFFDKPPVCAVNPSLGNEAAAAEQIRLAARMRRVVVVGGGPAGLEAARIAGQRGHRVTLVERSERLGGATWFAALTDSPNQSLVDWLEHELHELRHVVIRECGFEATPDSVAALEPDVVVVATGARQRADGELREQVTRLASAPPTELTIVGGDLIGLSIAEFLAGRGHAVTVLEPGPHLGRAMAMPRRWTAVATAAARGITLVRNAELSTAITSATSATSPSEVIVTNDRTPDRTLADAIVDRGIETHVIGDAAELGYIHGAIHSAHAVATRL
jgi:2-enoate reductase